MKTKKSSDKKETKVKSNKSLILRNESKVKQKSIQSSERLCNRCKVHGITVSFKGHKCPTIDCLCVKCCDYMEKNRRRNEQNKQKRLIQKKTNKDKPNDNSLVISLKNKSKKILNDKKKDKKEDNTGSASKKKKKSRSSGSGALIGGTHREVNHLMNRQDEEGNGPPRLVLQRAVNEPPIEEFIDNNSSATDVDVNHSNPMDIQPAPEKSSAALCAQYLKACTELSRKLSKCQFSEEELIASLKYFIVRQSLGDVDRAANDIIFASQEIRLGASYMVQHPGEDFQHSGAAQTSSVRQTAQPLGNSAAAPPMLCSTMYPNFRQNEAPTYSPAFTPIRNN